MEFFCSHFVSKMLQTGTKSTVISGKWTAVISGTSRAVEMGTILQWRQPLNEKLRLAITK